MKTIDSKILTVLFFLLSVSSAHADGTGLVTVGNARFTVVSAECIRLEYAEDAQFVDAPSLFAFNRETRFHDYQLSQTNQVTVIDTGKMKVTYTPDGHPFSASNLNAVIRHGSRSEFWTPGLTNSSNLGGTRMSLDQVKGPTSVEDGVLSRSGWYLLDDSKRFLLIDGWVASRPATAGTDWYLFGYGSDYKGALKSLTTIGGAVPLPRKYVLGSWYSRWWPYSAQEYKDIVQEFRDHHFPLDMVVMDMDWHKPDSWTGYSWNRSLFPEPEEYLHWLHQQGLHATLNDHPQAGVGPYEDGYSAFMKDMNRDPSKSEVLPYNAGDKKYLDTVFKHMHEPLEKIGVDFWWLDWAGGAEFPFNKMGWVNEYYFRHSETTAPDIRGQQFSRWADWGDHRHPIHFSGDTHIGWPTLQFEIPFTANSGNVGAFFWSHDIGGFEGPRNGELLARWTQFGAFSAALRIHSVNWIGLDKRPWTYRPEVSDSMRISYHLRRALFPYTYSSVWQSHHDSLPLVRPMYLEYPEEEEAYLNPQEYMYGDSILVAPIVTPRKIPLFGKASQTVWIPDGIWYDWFTGEKVVGKSKRVVSKDIYSFPLYFKGGVPVPMMEYTERMTQEPLNTLVVRVYPGEDGKVGTFQLYEDDGLTKEYLRGRFATTDLRYLLSGKEVTVEIGAAVGEYSDQLKARAYRIELPMTAPAKTATVNGQAVAVVFDKKVQTNTVVISVQDIRLKQVVHIAF